MTDAQNVHDSDEAGFIPLSSVRTLPDRGDEEIVARSRAFFELARQRRTVREFSTRAVPRIVIENAMRAAASAPSGANQQPWHFVAVEDPSIKSRIRVAAEAEERSFYAERAPDDWLAALEPLGTDADKPFLETAPWLIAIFAQPWGLDARGARQKHYYVSETVGIATGILIAALHDAGLVTLTHTPSPMGFLREILGRPEHERAFLLLVAGHPAPDARVPDIHRKDFAAVASFR